LRIPKVLTKSPFAPSRSPDAAHVTDDRIEPLPESICIRSSTVRRYGQANGQNAKGGEGIAILSIN
jgi:hypothetical protein